MGHKESKATGKLSATAKTESTAVAPKGARSRRRTNAKIVQSVLLIWLDANIDEDNDDDCHNTITQLQRVINNVNTFTNDDQCIEFLNTIDSNNHKACMITSGSLGQQIVARVHKMSQVDSIFIFCGNKKRHEQWAKDWTKIKGVFTEITPICEALKKVAQQCEHNATPISFMATEGDNTNQKKLDQLDCSFMYTQILRDILLTITFEQTHIQEFIEYCREQFADIEEQLVDVNELEREYHKRTPVWWYSRESFLYSMLNSALRLMDADIMIKMGFFITDLHRQIKGLHAEQFANHTSSATTFSIYRGQGMSKKDFEQMSKTKGGLMAFNSFLSTSKLHSVSLDFAHRALSNPDLVGILFVMTVDPTQSMTPFASINEVGCFEDQEDEVLFSMHSVFRIRDIEPMDKNDRLYQVDLTLTNDNDQDLRALTDRIEEEIDGTTAWDRLGHLLLEMNQSKKAEQIYEILVEGTSDKVEKATFYHRLGWAKYDQGEYREALALYGKSLAIRQQSLPQNHPDLAKSYNNIGAAYRNMGEYSKALSYYENALAIRQQSLPLNHPSFASSYNNIGAVYRNMGEYSKALSYNEKALAIRQQSLPPNHPALGYSCNSIGSVYSDMGEYSKALSYYEKDLKISQQSLPPNHPDLATSYNDIGTVYSDMGDYSKALSYCEKALAIRQQSLPPNHPDLAKSYNNIGNVYSYMGEYSKALSYYEKDLKISQQSLHPNHPDLASSYNNIGAVYSDMGEYSKALSYYEKALAIRQQSLPPSHPDLATSYGSIGNVYFDMGEYSKARSFFERTVEIAHQSLQANHPHLQIYSRNLDRLTNLQ